MGLTSNVGHEEPESLQPELAPNKLDLTVCDIIGDWGQYQWSLTLFALIYSALAATTVVVGPTWIPDMNHICYQPSNKTIDEVKRIFHNENATSNVIHECFVQIKTDRQIEPTLPEQSESKISNSEECSQFVYDDENYGKVLTNTPKLAKIINIKLFSFGYGRTNCLKIGFLLSILATIGTILASNYFLFVFCLMVMIFSQIGCANANCTLVMESTSPKWRFVSIFQFGFGWGFGVLISPLLNKLTKDYQYFLLVSLVWQILMTLWLRFSIFESIRWLLSEGEINRAQIELQRACRINKVKNGAGLAQKIAQVQVQQVRKASLMIAQKTAFSSLPDHDQTESRELNLLGEAIRRSFGLPTSLANDNNRENITSQGSTNEPTMNQNLPPVLSPILARKSFSVSSEVVPAQLQLQLQQQQLNQQSIEMSILDRMTPQARQSITTQCLIQLALKYGRNLQRQDEGSFFLTRMFHKKLFKATILLMMSSVMVQVAHYVLTQTTTSISSDVDLNHIAGALSQWIATATYVLILCIFSRKIALIMATVVSAIICSGIAISCCLIPNGYSSNTSFHDNENLAEIIAHQENETFRNIYSSINIGEQTQEVELIKLHESIILWLANIGKITVLVSIQVATTISLEYYPTNFRLTAYGAIVFVGRIFSFLAPLLFNDSSEDKTIFRIELISLSIFGFIICFLVPFLLGDTKNEELCNSVNEIKDDDDR